MNALRVFLYALMGLRPVGLRGNAWMNPAATADLHDLITYLRIKHSAIRFSFISGSMGGYGNLAYATRHPEDCSAIVALGSISDLNGYITWCQAQLTTPFLQELANSIIENFGNPPSNPDLYNAYSPILNVNKLTMPIYLSQGELDTIMPVYQSRDLAAAMRGNPMFTYIEIPGGNHDSPLIDANAISWLIEQTLK